MLGDFCGLSIQKMEVNKTFPSKTQESSAQKDEAWGETLGPTYQNFR